MSRSSFRVPRVPTVAQNGRTKHRVQRGLSLIVFLAATLGKGEARVIHWFQSETSLADAIKSHIHITVQYIYIFGTHLLQYLIKDLKAEIADG